jgi:hypothetical protein
VGARGKDIAKPTGPGTLGMTGVDSCGGAYVYSYAGDQQWVEQILMAPDPQVGSARRAASERGGGGRGGGGARVCSRIWYKRGCAVAQSGNAAGPGVQEGAAFGRSVAVRGDMVVVAADMWDDAAGAAVDGGRVYVYTRPGRRAGQPPQNFTLSQVRVTIASLAPPCGLHAAY